MNPPTDSSVPPDEPTRKYLCPNRQPVQTVSMKLEPHTENFEMEDTKPILGCLGSEMELNSNINFSNETILGLEVDYINRDSNNDTLTLSMVNTTNDSESCTFPPIKEEPEDEFETSNKSLKFEIKENDAHNTNTEMALSSFPPTKEELKVDYINRDSNNDTLTLSLVNTTNDSESCTLPPIKEEPEDEFETSDKSLKFEIKENDAHDTNTEMALSSFPPTKEELKINIEDTILSQSPSETKSHILSQDKSECNYEEIHSVAQRHYCITNKFKVEDYLNICMKNDYSIAGVSTNYKRKCWMYNCYKQAVKEGYCLAHGNKSRKMCKMEDCTKCPVKGGYCKPHGGTTTRKLCKKEDCLKWPVKGGYCQAHGGIKSRKPCKKDNCTKLPVKGGYCEAHGGTRTRKLCKMKDCSTTAVKGGYCIAHGGTKYDTRCNKEMCFKRPVKGGFCIAHGGTKYNRRCKKDHCSKFAVKAGYCIAHRT